MTCRPISALHWSPGRHSVCISGASSPARVSAGRWTANGGGFGISVNNFHQYLSEVS